MPGNLHQRPPALRLWNSGKPNGMCPLCLTICILAVLGGHPIKESLGRVENFGKGLQRLCVGGAGVCLRLWGEEHYLPPHPLPEMPATQICHVLGSKHSSNPRGTTLFRRKYHKRIKNISTRGDLDLYQHQGPRTKEGLWPSKPPDPHPQPRERTRLSSLIPFWDPRTWREGAHGMNEIKT